MRVNLILNDLNRGWIIEKLAVRLRDELCRLGHSAEVSSVFADAADVNHSLISHYVAVGSASLSTFGVTHVDDVLKMKMIEDALERGARAAICMSSMTARQLVDAGISSEFVTWVLPAHDAPLQPRRISIGITSNSYVDLRKREWMLSRLARDMRLDMFEFRFFGYGWDATASDLRAAGAEVEIWQPSSDYVQDYAEIRRQVPLFDYYLYTGLDEGSLGTLDAMSAGVPTIVTRQGFHVDIHGAITHGFWDYDELLAIFQCIAEERQSRISSANCLSWTRYAQSHVEIWDCLLEQGKLPDVAPVPIRAESPDRRGERFIAKGYTFMLLNRYRREMLLMYQFPKLYPKIKIAINETRQRVRRVILGRK